MTTINSQTNNLSSTSSLSCDLCDHVSICKIVEENALMLAKRFDENTAPFKYQDLAKICNKFRYKMDIER